MGASWDLDSVAAEFSAAALNPALWKPALHRLSETVGAVGAVLLPPVAQRFEAISTDSVAEVSQRYIKEGWYRRDLRDRSIAKMLKCGIAVDLDYASEHDFKKSDYYNDFLGRHGLRWFVGIAATKSADLWVVSIQRSIAQGPFDASEQEKIGRLCGPLNAASTVSTELGVARLKGLADAFDVMGSAAAILDQRGYVIRTNRTADASLIAELGIIKRRLVARDHETNKRIARLVDRAIRCDHSGSAPIAVVRAARRPLLVYAMPLMGDSRDVFSTARALVIVIDLDCRRVPPTTHLRQVFGLTPAEAKLVEQLAGGDRLDTVADSLEITKETARTQLKAVFAKTDTSRQSELVALVASLLRSPAGRKSVREELA